MRRLGNGDPFPTLHLPRAGGGSISLPEDLAGFYGVVLLYRGSWCPYCNAQLASFQRALDSLTQLDIRVVALSVDDEAAANTLVEKYRLTFPVGHSADPAAVADATGAYLSDDGTVSPVHGLRACTRRLRAHRRLLQRGYRPPGGGRRRRLHHVPARCRLTRLGSSDALKHRSRRCNACVVCRDRTLEHRQR